MLTVFSLNELKFKSFNQHPKLSQFRLSKRNIDTEKIMMDLAGRKQTEKLQIPY
jgi:hypothetical protein